MQSIDYRTIKLNRTGTETTGAQLLIKIARRWDGGISHELHKFAQFLWPDAHLLGLFLMRSYRLRKRLESGTVVWWIEHDIPPFDRYRCEAYRVELSLSRTEETRLVIRSGVSEYTVNPITLQGLMKALSRAGADEPLVIRRQFGPALDP